MKLIICLWANILVIIFIRDNIFASGIGIETFKKGKTQLRKLPTEEDPRPKSTELPDLPIYYKGWIKYLHYTQRDNSKPKAFYKNVAFDAQGRKGLSNAALYQKDENGYMNIPNELYFYSVLYKDSFNVFAFRNGFSNTVDSLDINYVKPIPEDNHFKGGIKDFGKFDEGFCFKIEAKIPTESFIPSADIPAPINGKDQLWVVCQDTQDDKTHLMNTMIQLKMKSQHDQGIYLVIDNQSNSDTDNYLNQGQKVGPGVTNSNSKSLVDGYWVLLQDWTQCTLKCGGGLQYQQLMCVPPKAGGKTCEGPAIRTRPCNAQACPLAQTLKNIVNPLDLSSSSSSSTLFYGNNTLAPIVKIMAVSKRPQRYDKCYLKESDVLMEKDDASTKSHAIKPKIPVRIVLNDKTISAYLDDSLTNKIVTFNLKETSLFRINNDKRCFRLKTNSKSALFCQLDSQSGDFIEEWDYDFSLFKNQCSKKREKSNSFLPEQNKLEKEFKEKIEIVKAELVFEIAQKNKQKVEDNEEIKLTKQVQHVQSTSMLALQKETKLEELLEKEEAEKEDDETHVLEIEIEAEKKKEECLNKVVKEKELENQMNVAKSKAEDAIHIIQEQTKTNIAKKRIEIKRKIMEMRKKQERKKSSLKSQIMTIRTTIVKKLNRLSKNGNGESCKNTSTEIERTNYCSSNFVDNYIKYEECICDSSFCYVCCENEYGEFHILERDKCYANCDLCRSKS